METHRRLLDEIEGAASLSSGDAVALLGSALDAAARAEESDRDALDRSALQILRDAPHRDRILERLDLESLAALSGRVAARRDRTEAWDLLDLLRRPAVLRRIAQAGATAAWAERILALVDRSNLTMATLLRRRAAEYGAKVFFEAAAAGTPRSLTWRQFAARVEALARGLVALAAGREPRVAIVSENRLEMAVADLACHAAGLVSVMIPASATEADAGFMLRQSGATIAIGGSREILALLRRVKESIPGMDAPVAMDASIAGGLTTLDAIAGRAGETPLEDLDRRRLAVSAGDLATIMYTSGTTGTPKGICFSHRNVVFKRFARALALPEIGEDDVFLCYLPLFHTFGRFLELYGSIFWGATYVALDNPSVEALVAGMRRWRPTVFISVPKKWLQVHETIVREADPDKVGDDEIGAAVKRITGGRLRWGLSAAGHLDAEVFRFFQQHGVELMSGFGMTEATGGITMTRPGAYKDDSLGPALPGIELRIDADGELAVRGPYVMIGHVASPEGERTLDADGWFRTGDLMTIDGERHIRLVDRKKEIYKNIKGETIAPQRIELLFRDFASVGRVFLVGDHREYNTALIWPNPETQDVDFASMTAEERKSHFRSIVASVNAFLAPYERIVDFALIDRDLSQEKDELTPKGTPRRKIVETHFAETIRLLYRRVQLKVGGLEIVFPNWLFQAVGLTAQDLTIEPERIALPGQHVGLTLRRLQEGVALVGSCVYVHPPREAVPLGVLLTTPRLWMGNEELVEFAPIETRLRERPGRAGDMIERRGRLFPGPSDPAPADAVRRALSLAHPDLIDLHAAARLLESSDEDGALDAVRLLERVAVGEESAISEPARELLRRASASPYLAVRRRAFTVLVPFEREGRVQGTLRRFLAAPGVLLDTDTRAALCERNLSTARLDAFLTEASEAGRGAEGGRARERRAAALFRFLAEYGASHPSRYRALRAFFVRTMLFAATESAREEAFRALDDLVKGFRGWLGPTVQVAVDSETGQEYRWADVVAFDDGVPQGDRERILGAIRGTSFLREAVFLFSGGAEPRLPDIPPGGIWIRPLGSRPDKSVYRITVQTRFQGAYDLAVNLNHGRPKERVRDEIHWLVLCGEPGTSDPLVEDFGGYWPEQDLWSEEFIPGESLDRTLRRVARQGDEERFRGLWPYFAWSALAAHVDFWNRTGRQREIADPGMANLIVPPHDYQSGARIVSVAAVREHRGLVPMLRFFHEELLKPVEAAHPVLAGAAGWDMLFSPVMEIIGEEEGTRLLREALHREANGMPDDMRAGLARFLDGVDRLGFRPLRLYFAIRRYRRWADLSADATPQARARTMHEFWDTYGLAKLARGYPETRARFFLQTVFKDSPAPLAEGLEEIVGRLRRGELPSDGLIDAVADLRARLDVSAADDYFLARLSFPYLRPEDEAGFVVHDAPGGRAQNEIVVTLEDHDGAAFQVRHALSPKEVARLHRLFLAASLDVRFRPEHQYLVAVNDKGTLIGGIVYEIEDEGRSAHLEKIVVAERYRKKGVADGLMQEFFNRVKASGAGTVTTGFFRPEYFYGYGFKIEKRYAGLVKELS
ncbi:MAG TPA: GNAT family N-acetyltransferase [Candidatus Polarisedimenticolaceae bacterium]|nr:GNAT family N-acetyltransferase [Candidatus Polarisedimenticolaceae bacterium]